MDDTLARLGIDILVELPLCNITLADLYKVLRALVVLVLLVAHFQVNRRNDLRKNLLSRPTTVQTTSLGDPPLETLVPHHQVHELASRQRN